MRMTWQLPSGLQPPLMPKPAELHYRSAEGERQLGALYDRMLSELPFAAHQVDVATPTFGRTRVTGAWAALLMQQRQQQAKLT